MVSAASAGHASAWCLGVSRTGAPWQPTAPLMHVAAAATFTALAASSIRDLPVLPCTVVLFSGGLRGDFGAVACMRNMAGSISAGAKVHGDTAPLPASTESQGCATS